MVLNQERHSAPWEMRMASDTIWCQRLSLVDLWSRIVRVIAVLISQPVGGMTTVTPMVI